MGEPVVYTWEPEPKLEPEPEPEPELSPAPARVPDRRLDAEPVTAPDQGLDELERTGVTLEGGKVAISALTHADDSAVVCDT